MFGGESAIMGSESAMIVQSFNTSRMSDPPVFFCGGRNKQSRKPENNKKHRKGLSPPMMERAKNARLHELL